MGSRGMIQSHEAKPDPSLPYAVDDDPRPSWVPGVMWGGACWTAGFIAAWIIRGVM